MNNINLVDLIYGALKSQNNQHRKNSQDQLMQFRNTRPDDFFLQCAFYLNNQQENDFIRQSASTLLVNSIRAKNNNIFYWDMLQIQTKQNVKNNLLSTLVDHNLMIVRSGANVISHIASIEIPRNQWLDLVSTLVQNTTYNDINIRRASIITIGNICQQFNETSVTIEHQLCQQFLGGILVGLQENDFSINEESMKALRNSLSFLKPIMNNQPYRNKVFEVILSRIVNVTQDDENRMPYQALFQFCKYYYQFLSPYFQTIINTSIPHLGQRNQNTILALQLIDTIGSQYLERMNQAIARANNLGYTIQNYLLDAQNELLPQIMKCLLIENQEDLDFPQMRNSASKTLTTMATLGNRKTLDIISQGIATCLNETSLGRQQASAIFLSSLCQNNDLDYVKQIINNAFEPVISLLNSNTQIVILNTLNGLITISQFFPSIFYNNQNVHNIFNKLFSLIDPFKINITTNILSILKNVTQKLQPNCILFSDTSILLTKIVNFYENFLDNFEEANKQYAEKSVVIIMNCMMSIRSREVVLFMIQFIMNKYYFFYDKNINDQQIRLSSLACLFHTCLLAMENMIPKQQLVNGFCNLIDKHIQMFGVQQEGLNMISGMAITFNRAFEQKTEKYWGYIQMGLQLISQPKTFKSALSCVGDFGRIYGEIFLRKELDILDRLLILIHESLDRQIKINILQCISDLMLGIGQSLQPYIERVIEMIMICFQGVYELSKLQNEKQYVEQLKRGIIEMYTCMVFAMNGRTQKQKSEVIFNHFPYLATFVVNTCKQDQQPTIEYVRLCLYLLFDLTTFYFQSQYHQNSFRNILTSEQIRKLVKLLDNHMNREDIKDLKKLIDDRYERF